VTEKKRDPLEFRSPLEEIEGADVISEKELPTRATVPLKNPAVLAETAAGGTVKEKKTPPARNACAIGVGVA